MLTQNKNKNQYNLKKNLKEAQHFEIITPSNKM